MSKLRQEWEKKRQKIWEKELRGYNEDACEQIPEEREADEQEDET